MIFLREGKVILYIGYDVENNVNIEMSSAHKYNNGSWTKVDAFRQYQVAKGVEKCILSVGGDDKRIGLPRTLPEMEDIPDLAQAKYYIGGVPPSFRAKNVVLPSQVSFLGCMANIVVQEGYDPMAEQYYGVEPSCGNKVSVHQLVHLHRHNVRVLQIFILLNKFHFAAAVEDSWILRRRIS